MKSGINWKTDWRRILAGQNPRNNYFLLSKLTKMTRNLHGIMFNR